MPLPSTFATRDYCPLLAPAAARQRVQPTVTFPIGDHVDVLHDYKKTGPSKILKLLSSRRRHLVDMLVKFCKNHIFLTF